MPHPSIRAHIENKIQEATLERSPFPHMIIENFFPPEIFNLILEHNLFRQNKGTEWLSKSYTQKLKTSTPYYARKQINFHRDDEFVASDEAKAFWQDLKSHFLEDDWFERLIFAKYPEYFYIRFGDFVDDDSFFESFRKELFLQRHEPGYFIGPHTDIPTRVFTGIFSFAEQDGFEDYGTELCVHKDPLARCWGCDHYEPDDFIVKKLPHTSQTISCCSSKHDNPSIQLNQSIIRFPIKDMACNFSFMNRVEDCSKTFLRLN